MGKSTNSVSSTTDSSQPNFYVVSQKKLILLYFFTGGLYLLYWIYKNWKCCRDDGISAFIRTLFFIFFAHGLFEDISEKAKEKAPRDVFNYKPWAWLFILTSTLYSFSGFIAGMLGPKEIILRGILSSEWLILAHLTIDGTILYKVQKYINIASEDREGISNNSITIPNIIWIILGSMLILGNIKNSLDRTITSNEIPEKWRENKTLEKCLQFQDPESCFQFKTDVKSIPKGKLSERINELGYSSAIDKCEKKDKDGCQFVYSLAQEEMREAHDKGFKWFEALSIFDGDNEGFPIVKDLIFTCDDREGNINGTACAYYFLLIKEFTPKPPNKWRLEMQCDGGAPTSCLLFGNYLLKNNKIKEAKLSYEKACNMGVPDGCLYLATSFGEKDPGRLKTLYKKSCELSENGGIFSLGSKLSRASACSVWASLEFSSNNEQKAFDVLRKYCSSKIVHAKNCTVLFSLLIKKWSTLPITNKEKEELLLNAGRWGLNSIREQCKSWNKSSCKLMKAHENNLKLYNSTKGENIFSF